MKKILALTIMAFLFFATGCGNNQAKYEETMEEYAKDYFEQYMPKQSLDEAEVTIEMLKNANTNGNSDYDLDKLSKCEDSSKVIFSLNKEEGTITDTTFELNCK